MNTHFRKTKQQAIDLAKELLRERLNLKRLSVTLVKDSSTNCDCGESPAVIVVAYTSYGTEEQKVGICDKCCDI